MSQPESSLALRPRRIRNDWLFYLVLGTIGMTYVVLILGMLFFDGLYVFTSDMRRSVIIDFAVDGEDKPLDDGDRIDDQFAKYAMTVSAGDSSQFARIADSGQPPESHRDLGSPNEDFGGPGRGEGGGLQPAGNKAAKNSVPLGNILVLSTDDQKIRSPAEGGRFVFAWEDPVQLDEIHLLDIDRSGGSIVTYDQAGEVISQRQVDDSGANSVQSVKIEDHDVTRLEIDLPCSGAVTEVAFTWHGHVRAPWERDSPGLAKLLYNPVTAALAKPEIQYSIKLSLISCTITAILSLWVAIPIGYLLSRHKFFGRNLLDAILDIPIVLPPLVVGLSLLILFQFMPHSLRDAVVYEIPAVILAQFMVACAFAVRTMRATFDQIDARREQVALTLGCSRFQAFGMVVLPEARRGVLTAGTLAWARALGEFGPLLIFAGATRNKTEVLSTTVFLELSIGDLGAAVAVSLIMVVAAVIVLVVARLWGNRNLAS